MSSKRRMFTIHWGPVDDFMQGPNALIIRWLYRFKLIIRPRPFWLFLKIWWTRGQLAEGLIDFFKNPGLDMVTPTLEIGSEVIIRDYPKQHTIYDV